MKLNLSKPVAILMLAVLPGLLPAVSATTEAESGALGADWAVNLSGSPVFITITGTGAGGNPGSLARVASYNVTFPATGTYNLYVRVRVGGGGFNDDSLFYGNGFGAKSPTTDNDWQSVNGLAASGFTGASDAVAGNGAAGIQVWKWVNLSQFNPGGSGTEPPLTFSVAAGNLAQTFQIGAREDGLDLDKFVFGITNNTFTVTDLDNGTGGNPPSPPAFTNAFVGPDGIALHRFSPLPSGLNADGANPAAGVAVINGVISGTTQNGGAHGVGTAFSLNADGSNFVGFRTFAPAPDANHSAGELAGAGNAFFGTSLAGGDNGAGTVFTMQTNGSLTVLRHFAAVYNHTATNSGGASPSARLAWAGGTLYGATTAGGAGAQGTIFALSTNGGTFSVLHDFSRLDSQAGTNVDGAVPWGGVIAAGGKLYGTASSGGAGGAGVVFSLATNGAGFSVLHNFALPDALTATNPGGAIPYGGLVLGDRTLYGTTCAGGQGGRGIIFSVATNGSAFAVLHHFSATDSLTRTNHDGAAPSAGLILSSNVLYGTASAGGSGAAGVVFSFHLNNALFTPLHSFGALASTGTNAHGAYPVAPVLRVGEALIGTTYSGGPGAAGTVFRVPLPPAPARITDIVRNVNGTVTLHFLGTPTATNVIQATTQLTPPVVWQNVATNVADAGGAWQFTDANNLSTRYYRSYAK